MAIASDLFSIKDFETLKDNTRAFSENNFRK